MTIQLLILGALHLNITNHLYSSAVLALRVVFHSLIHCSLEPYECVTVWQRHGCHDMTWQSLSFLFIDNIDPFGGTWKVTHLGAVVWPLKSSVSRQKKIQAVLGDVLCWSKEQLSLHADFNGFLKKKNNRSL